MSIFDDVVGKAKGLKSDYDQRKQAEKLERLNSKEGVLERKERELADKDARLRQQAVELAQLERSLHARRRRPLYVLLACLLAVGLTVAVVFRNYDLTAKVRAPEPSPAIGVSTSSPSDMPKSEGSVDEPTAGNIPEANTTGEELQRIYRGLDMSDGDFDVGGYCLEQEKRGGITFEECLGVAVAKAADAR